MTRPKNKSSKIRSRRRFKEPEVKSGVSESWRHRRKEPRSVTKDKSPEYKRRVPRQSSPAEERTSGLKELDRTLEDMSLKILKLSRDFSQKNLNSRGTSPANGGSPPRSQLALNHEELQKMRAKEYDIEAIISSQDNNIPEWNEDGSVKEQKQKSREESEEEESEEEEPQMSRFSPNRSRSPTRGRILAEEELMERRLPSGMKARKEDSQVSEREGDSGKEIDLLDTEEARGSDYIQRLPSQVRRKMLQGRKEDTNVHDNVDNFLKQSRKSKHPKNKFAGKHLTHYIFRNSGSLTNEK